MSRVKKAALVGALAEIVLALPLVIASPSTMTRPVPTWAWILARSQDPGGSIVLHVLRAEWVKQIAHRFKAAHGIFLAAQGLVMFIQAVLFGLLAFGLIYLWHLRREQPKLST
jgi:hypothetical protein